MAGPGAPLLRVTGLACARGGIPVIEGLSLELVPGEARAVIGPNGAGKTTLLRCLAGLSPPEAGAIALPEEGAAFAGHADAVKPALSAAANLAFWARIHGTPPAAVPGALEALALGPLAGRPAGTLSAGQRRRLGLARLMVSGRRLWLMDEPTVALDAASVGLVAGLVRAHLAAGGAALIATHADVGLPEAAALDLAPYRARAGAGDGFERGVA